MSVADWDVEPVDKFQGFCCDHGQYYDHEYGCEGCKDDAADPRKGE